MTPKHEPEIGSRQRITESIAMLIAEGATPEAANRLAHEAERDLQTALSQGRMWRDVFDMIAGGNQ